LKDNQLCIMGMLIVVAYAIYMVFGPGGDGIIFGSVIAAVCVLAGVKYERYRIQKELIRDANAPDDTTD